MPISSDFEYVKPSTIKETLDLLAEYGAKAKIIAGGTDLANLLKKGLPVPDLLIDIKGLTELELIKLTDGKLEIGALVTFSSIIKSDLIKEKFNILWDAAHLVASNGIRNRATMVGNICSAVACMDSAAPLLVHDAVLHLRSKNSNRDIPISQWFIDNKKTAIANDELVTGVSITLPLQKYAGSYQKLMRYSGEDLSQANVGILALEDKSFRVAFGAVGPIPKRSLKIEHFLDKKEISMALLEEAKTIIDSVISPITDIRATKEYRIHMTKVMFERGMKEAIEKLKELK